MKIRRFALTLLVAMCVGSPLPALIPKSSKVARVGILAFRRQPADLTADFYWQVVKGLGDLGYVEGKNVVITWRFAGGDPSRLETMAAELAAMPVDVIVTLDGTRPALTAQKITRTIPIVFVNVLDPVASGLARTLARPGENATGLSLLGGDTSAKQFEFLAAMSPRGTSVAVLWNPTNPAGKIVLQRLQGAAPATHTTLVPFEAGTVEGIAPAFEAMRRANCRSLLVAADPLFTQERDSIAKRAAELRLPSIGYLREYAEAGGLMSYGSSRADSCRRAATYVAKILEGAHPADLPVEQPTVLELVINKKTATELGLTIPPELLVQADKVIE